MTAAWAALLLLLGSLVLFCKVAFGAVLHFRARLAVSFFVIALISWYAGSTVQLNALDAVALGSLLLAVGILSSIPSLRYKGRWWVSLVFSVILLATRVGAQLIPVQWSFWDCTKALTQEFLISAERHSLVRLAAVFSAVALAYAVLKLGSGISVQRELHLCLASSLSCSFVGLAQVWSHLLRMGHLAPHQNVTAEAAAATISVLGGIGLVLMSVIAALWLDFVFSFTTQNKANIE